MTKRIKRFCIIGLTAIGLLCAALLLIGAPSAASAEETRFNFTGGAYLKVPTEDVENVDASSFKLAFELNKLTTEFEDVRNELASSYKSDPKPYYTYFVDVYRKGREETDSKLIYSEGIEYRQASPVDVSWAQNKLVYYAENIEFADQYYKDAKAFATMFENDELVSSKDGFQMRIKRGVTQSNLPFWDSSDGKKITRIVITPDSPNTQYFVKFRYKFFRFRTSGFLNNKSETITGECTSEARSLHEIFTSMNTLGVLEAQLKSVNEKAYDYADSVLNKRTLENISITYLEEIAGTPFATKKTISAQAYAINGVIGREDLLSATNKETFSVFSDAWTHSSNGNAYTITYNKSKWLRARAVDGNDQDYFLDINLSYADFYKKYINTGVMTNDAFEYVYSTAIYKKYSKQLENYTTEEVYGYFGFVVIPKSYTLNRVFAELFDVEQSSEGAVHGLNYGLNLTLGSYNNLLKAYGYDFLGRIWNDVWKVCTTGEESATAYVLYMTPSNEKAHISDTGDDDGTPPILKPIQTIGGIIGKIFNGITSAFDTAINFVNSLSGTWKVVLAVAIIAAVVVLIVAYKKYSRKR